MIPVRRSFAFVSRMSPPLELSRMHSCCRRRSATGLQSLYLILWSTMGVLLGYQTSFRGDQRRCCCSGGSAGLFDAFYRRVTQAERDEGLAKLGAAIKHVATKMVLHFGQVETRFL